MATGKMGKLMDWKGILFWNCYYGAWLYGWFKNGSPGRIKQTDQQSSAKQAAVKAKEVAKSSETSKKLQELAQAVPVVTEKVATGVKDAVVAAAKSINDNVPPMAAELEQQVTPIVTEVLAEVQEVVKEAPHVAEVVLKEAQEIATELAHDLPQVAEKVITEVEEVAAHLPDDLKAASSAVSEALGLSDSKLSDPISLIMPVKEMTMMDLFWEKVDLAHAWCSTALNQGDSAIGEQGPLSGLRSWPAITGLAEWPQSSGGSKGLASH